MFAFQSLFPPEFPQHPTIKRHMPGAMSTAGRVPSKCPRPALKGPAGSNGIGDQWNKQKWRLPLKTNMEPENEPLEEEIPMKNHHF